MITELFHIFTEVMHGIINHQDQSKQAYDHIRYSFIKRRESQ